MDPMDYLLALFPVALLFWLGCTASKPRTIAHSSYSHFALRLFHAVVSRENVIISPLSIGVSLCLLMDGTKGETRRQITNLLDPSAMDDQIASFYRNIIKSLSKSSQQVVIQIATAVFVNKTIRLSPKYSDRVKKFYAAITRTLNFSDAAESAKIVNAFIKKATNNMIVDPISADSFKPDLGAVLINAVYFEGDWRMPFESSRSAPGIFFGLSGERTVEYMNGTRFVPCAMVDGVKILALPYKDPTYSLYLMMPSSGFVEWRDALNAGYIQAAIDILPSKEDEWKNSEVSVPKFQMKTSTEMIEVLKSVGVSDCFEKGLADLSGMSPETPMFVERFTQKSILTVDEVGTRAATVTESYPTEYCPPENMEFTKPFIFTLMRGRDAIFIGQYV